MTPKQSKTSRFCRYKLTYVQPGVSLRYSPPTWKKQVYCFTAFWSRNHQNQNRALRYSLPKLLSHGCKSKPPRHRRKQATPEGKRDHQRGGQAEPFPEPFLDPSALYPQRLPRSPRRCALLCVPQNQQHQEERRGEERREEGGRSGSNHDHFQL